MSYSHHTVKREPAGMKWVMGLVASVAVTAALVGFWMWRRPPDLSRGQGATGRDVVGNSIPVAEQMKLEKGWHRLAEKRKGDYRAGPESLAEQVQLLLMQSPSAWSENDIAKIEARLKSDKPKFDSMDDVIQLAIGRELLRALASGSGEISPELAVRFIPDRSELAEVKHSLREAARDPEEVCRLKRMAEKLRQYVGRGRIADIGIELSGSVSVWSGISRPVADFVKLISFLDEEYPTGRFDTTASLPLFSETDAQVFRRLDGFINGNEFKEFGRAFPKEKFPILYQRVTSTDEKFRLAPSIKLGRRGENEVLDEIIRHIEAERDKVLARFDSNNIPWDHKTFGPLKIPKEKVSEAVRREYEFFADFFRILADEPTVIPLTKPKPAAKPAAEPMSYLAPARSELSPWISPAINARNVRTTPVYGMGSDQLLAACGRLA